MNISEKHRNRLLNLVRSDSSPTPEQRAFLYNRGQENFDAVRDMLRRGELRRMNHISGAIRILYMLRVFDRHEDFVRAAAGFVHNANIGIRSCCFNLLAVLAAENLRKMTEEFDRTFVEKEIIPLIRTAADRGVSPDSAELAQRLLDTDAFRGCIRQDVSPDRGIFGEREPLNSPQIHLPRLRNSEPEGYRGVTESV